MISDRRQWGNPQTQADFLASTLALRLLKRNESVILRCHHIQLFQPFERDITSA